MKAFVVGFEAAKTIGQQIDVIAKIYEYLGLPFNRAEIALTPEEEKQVVPAPGNEKAPTLPPGVWAKKLRKLIQPLGLLIGLLGFTGPHSKDVGPVAPTDEIVDVSQNNDEQPAIPETAAPENEPADHFHTMSESDVVWNVVRNILRKQTGGRVSNADVMVATKAVCEKNGINDEGVGAIGGFWDARRLRPGLTIDVSDAYQYAELMQAARGK